MGRWRLSEVEHRLRPRRRDVDHSGDSVLYQRASPPWLSPRLSLAVGPGRKGWVVVGVLRFRVLDTVRPQWDDAAQGGAADGAPRESPEPPGVRGGRGEPR